MSACMCVCLILRFVERVGVVMGHSQGRTVFYVWNGLPFALHLLPSSITIHYPVSLKLFFLALLGPEALLSSDLEEVLYKCHTAPSEALNSFAARGTLQMSLRQDNTSNKAGLSTVQPMGQNPAL